MSANSARKVYSIGNYSVYVANEKAYERGTAPLRAFIVLSKGGNRKAELVTTFIGSKADLEAMKIAEILAKDAVKANPVSAFLKRIFS